MPTIPVEAFMTRDPRCIDTNAPLSDAYLLMHELDARHLPVLLDGRIAGILSHRDLLRFESLVNSDRTNDPVSDAMTPDPYVVEPSTDVAQVVQEMAASKLGCAVVARGARVLGIFTTTDALQALAAMLRRNTLEKRRVAFRDTGIYD